MELLKAGGNGNGAEHPFFCSEVGEICKDTATAWKQCERCMSWHAVPKEDNNNDSDDNIANERAEGGESEDAASTGAPFTCEFVGKKCSPKKFKRAKIALSG